MEIQYEVIRQLIEISLTVSVLVVFLVYGVKRFNKVLEEHRDEREKQSAEWRRLIDEIDAEHRKERAEKDQVIRDLNVYTRELTKETYKLLNEFSKRIEDVSDMPRKEREEFKTMINESHPKTFAQILLMLEAIGEKLGVEGRNFYKTDV